MHLRELGRGLTEPRVRTALGVVFAFALSWQLLFGGSHIAIMYTIYGSWAVAVLCLFIMSRAPADEARDDQGASEGSDV
jgi:hypothetical protein